MHIGIDARFVQGQNTGVTNYILHLLEGLSRLDKINSYSIFLSNPSYNGRVPKVNNFNLRVNTINSLIWKNVWLPKQVRKLKIDVLHFPAYTASFLNPGSYIVTVPDVIHRVEPGWFSTKELFLLDIPIKSAIKKAKHIIAISECTKRDIIKYYNVPEEKISVTLLAANESFRPIKDISLIEHVKNKYGIDSDFILNVGVLFKRRNLPRLLEAFAKLKQNRPIKHKLVIAGPGKAYFDLNAYIKKYNLGTNVIYLGYVEQKDMPVLYNAASFFIYPSLYEGFGLPVLEAMSCGKAVITSNVSSLPEVIGDAGITVNPYKGEELYEAMLELAGNIELREQLGSLALQRSNIFSWDKMTEQTLEIYKKINS